MVFSVNAPVSIKFYQVKSDDETIESIAQKHNLDPQKIKDENPKVEVTRGAMFVLPLT